MRGDEVLWHTESQAIRARVVWVQLVELTQGSQQPLVRVHKFEQRVRIVWSDGDAWVPMHELSSVG